MKTVQERAQKTVDTNNRSKIRRESHANRATSQQESLTASDSIINKMRYSKSN